MHNDEKTKENLVIPEEDEYCSCDDDLTGAQVTNSVKTSVEKETAAMKDATAQLEQLCEKHRCKTEHTCNCYRPPPPCSCGRYHQNPVVKPN